MLKSIKMGLLCFCVINLSVACSSEDPSITDETPGQNTGNGGNDVEIEQDFFIFFDGCPFSFCFHKMNL